MDIAIHKGGWRAIAWNCHAKTTVVVCDETTITGKRELAECDSEEVAALMSAAPDLLSALIALKTANGASNFNGWHEAFLPAIQMANDAIAKATGKAV